MPHFYLVCIYTHIYAVNVNLSAFVFRFQARLTSSCQLKALWLGAYKSTTRKNGYPLVCVPPQLARMEFISCTRGCSSACGLVDSLKFSKEKLQLCVYGNGKQIQSIRCVLLKKKFIYIKECFFVSKKFYIWFKKNFFLSTGILFSIFFLGFLYFCFLYRFFPFLLKIIFE